MNKGLTLALASMMALTLVGCNKGSTDIATVNGSPITESEFYDYLETKTSFTVSAAGVNSQQQLIETLQGLQQGRAVNLRVAPRQTPGMQALRDLVTRKVTEQLAKEDGFEATKEDIDKEINFQKELDESFVKNLQQNMGMTMEQIRRQIGFELAQQYLITKGIEVSDKDLDEFIETNRETNFTEPATAGYTMVLAANDAARSQIDAELAKGRRFEDVANELANGSTIAVQKPAGPAPIRALPQPLQDAINATNPSETTGWVQLPQDNGQTAFARLYITAKTQAKEMDMSGAKREQVRRQLAIQRGTQGKDINQMLLKEVVAAKVDLKKSTLKSMWTRYKEELEAELKRIEAESTTVPSTPEIE